MFLDEFNHCLLVDTDQWYGFYPFSEVIYPHQDKLLLLRRRWSDLSYDVQRPTSKWPWLNNCVQLIYWYMLDACVLLALLTSFGEFDTVLQHAWPIKPLSKHKPFHLMTSLVGATCPTVYVDNCQICLSVSQTLK